MSSIRGALSPRATDCEVTEQVPSRRTLHWLLTVRLSCPPRKVPCHLSQSSTSFRIFNCGITWRPDSENLKTYPALDPRLPTKSDLSPPRWDHCPLSPSTKCLLTALGSEAANLYHYFLLTISGIEPSNLYHYCLLSELVTEAVNF